MSEVDPKLKANRRIFVLVISVVTLLLFEPPVYAIIGQFLPARSASYVEISFSQLVNDVDAGRVHDVLIKGTEIGGAYNDGHLSKATRRMIRRCCSASTTKGL